MYGDVPRLGVVYTVVGVYCRFLIVCCGGGVLPWWVSTDMVVIRHGGFCRSCLVLFSITVVVVWDCIFSIYSTP